tara:strand:+ start:150 stop:395 length:246 start_codon:yes stop_codon:yes gene_type:complete
MLKQEILTALGLLSLLMIMIHLKNEPTPPHQEMDKLEIEFSEYEIQKDVKKDTLSEQYPRYAKPNPKKCLEKYGKRIKVVC